MGRLLFLTERFSPDLGGVARSARRISSTLGLETEVHVLAWTRTLQPGELETAGPDEAGAVTLHRLGLFSNWDLSMQHTLNVLSWLNDRHDFDAVWGHYLHPAGFLGVLFAETVGIPSTVSARGNDVDRLTFPPGDFARLSWTLHRATLVSAVSADLAKKIGVLLPGLEPTVIRNVVDAKRFHPGPGDPERRAAVGIADDEAVLGFCGELRHKKGLPFLLDALVRVRRERAACLLVIGDVRPREQAAISRFALECPKDAERIVVTGHMEDPDDVARDLRLCDVFLQPSLWDGLPNALLEAMACGRPAIASDAGGIPEAVEHGRTGVLLPKAQLHHLGEAVLEVLSMSDADRAAMGAAARQEMIDEFGSDRERRTVAEILGRLRQGRDTSSS